MNSIIFPVKSELEIFEDKLRKIIKKDDNFFKDELEEFIFSNPKRLRPILVFLFAKILKIDDIKVFDIALALELFHNASLLHDDIIDEEEHRRGIATFCKKFGDKKALLEGDLLLSLGLEVLSNTDIEIVKIFSKKIKKTILGEIKQNQNVEKILDENEYFIKTFEKTGNLFFAGLESLFELKEVENSLKEKLRNFLKNFSLAFQIKNDLENFKNSKTDVKNGTYTLPVIYYFLKYGDLNFDNNFDEILSKTSLKIAKLNENAINYIKDIEPVEIRQALIELSEFALGR